MAKTCPKGTRRIGGKCWDHLTSSDVSHLDALYLAKELRKEGYQVITIEEGCWNNLFLTPVKYKKNKQVLRLLKKRINQIEY